MGKSKQNKAQKKDGNHRAETKEEKIERLRQQEEARQACFKVPPAASEEPLDPPEEEAFAVNGERGEL